jgi:hypothetical protein
MAIVVLGLVLYILQFAVAKILATPWYTPILGTLGVGLLVLALFRARTVWRFLAVGIFGLLVVGEWYFLLSVSVLPAYSGPVAAGRSFPAFTTTFADGSPFTQANLGGEKNTVLVFFRGRW